MILPDGISLLGVNMLFVSFTLFIVALNLAGKVGGKETAAFCILTGSVNALSAIYNGFILGDTVSMAACFLFAFTYFFFAMNILKESDTYTGLGNYALGVAVTAAVYIYASITGGTYVLAFYWLLWGQLWACFWIANGLKKNITKFLIGNTYFVVVVNFIGAIGFLFGWLAP